MDSHFTLTSIVFKSGKQKDQEIFLVLVGLLTKSKTRAKCCTNFEILIRYLGSFD